MNMPHIRTDADSLLKTAPTLARKMKWSLNTSVYQWQGVTIGKNERMHKLNISFKHLTQQDVIHCAFPPGYTL